MIAQRFRPVGWVASIALAATALYLVSLQVASERGRLETIDRKIAATKRDIRQLQTEMGTRASLRQLERWNGEVLALSAPQASQYLTSDAALASLNRDQLGRSPSAPPPIMVAANIQTTGAQPGEAKPPSGIFAVLTPAKPLPKLTVQDRAVQQAIAPRKSAPVKDEDVALLDRKLVDRSTLTTLAKNESATDSGKGKTKR